MYESGNEMEFEEDKIESEEFDEDKDQE